jgi:hypothetical protein
MSQKIHSACCYLAHVPSSPFQAAGIVLAFCLMVACTPLGVSPAPANPFGTPVATAVTPAALNTPPSVPTASPAVAAETRLCRLEELSASMGWQRSGGALVAQVQLANFGAQPCAVQGAPQIELVNENGWKLPVDQVQAETIEAPARVVLDPAGTYTAEARFIWRNWCTPAPKENLHLEIVLPDNPGQLSVPVQDPNGQYLTNTPRCDDRSSPSTLTVETFK